MNRFSKHVLIWLFLGTLAFAEGLDTGSGVPPFGLHVEGAAKGTKLNGSLFAEIYNCVPSPLPKTCEARIVLRLRKGNTNQVETFYGEASGIHPSIPSEVQDDIIAAMAPQVIDRFFGNNNGIFTDDPLLDIRLRSVTEFGAAFVDETDLTPEGSQFILTDLQITVS